MSADNCALLESKSFSSVLDAHVKNKPIHLFFRNKDVDEFNSLALQSIPGELILSSAFDSVHGDGIVTGRKTILANVQHRSIKLSETI